MKFGEKLRELRQNKGMTQGELAKAIGKSLRTIVGYEKCANYPRDREVYTQLAKLFEVDTNYLLTENEEFMTEVGQNYGRRGTAQAQEILEQTSQLFAGGFLSESDELAFLNEIQQIFLDSKKEAKKFTPKKFRKNHKSSNT